MNKPQDNSINAHEDEASNKIWPDIQEHVNYLNQVYNLCFAIQSSLDGKPFDTLTDTGRAQFMILMRITDFLRSIILLSVKGYPEQAGTLASSVFELAHTAFLFSYKPEAVKTWLEANSIKEQAPKIFGVNDWLRLVEENCKQVGCSANAKSEYRVYKQLCWMKHSLPKMQDMIVEGENVSFMFGPYSDERSVSHAWFSMEHAGRLTEMVIAQIQSILSPEQQQELQNITGIRNALFKKAKVRFNSENPFEAI